MRGDKIKDNADSSNFKQKLKNCKIKFVAIDELLLYMIFTNTVHVAS